MAGLRERKQAHTRARLQDEALRLFAAQGYDATRCEEIAAAADVSPATFFRYFSTKEDAVLSDVYDPMIAQAVRAQPAGQAPLTAIRGGFAAALGQVGADELETVRHRTALILGVPQLRARTHEQSRSLSEHLADALAARAGAGAGAGVGTGDAAPDLATRVLAASATAAVTVAAEHWSGAGGDLAGHVDAALGVLDDLARGGRP